MLNNGHRIGPKDKNNIDFKLLMTDWYEQQRLYGILIRVAKAPIDGMGVTKILLSSYFS